MTTRFTCPECNEFRYGLVYFLHHYEAYHMNGECRWCGRTLDFIPNTPFWHLTGDCPNRDLAEAELALTQGVGR